MMWYWWTTKRIVLHWDLYDSEESSDKMFRGEPDWRFAVIIQRNFPWDKEEPRLSVAHDRCTSERITVKREWSVRWKLILRQHDGITTELLHTLDRGLVIKLTTVYF
jgi:hypothetical protein